MPNQTAPTEAAKSGVVALINEVNPASKLNVAKANKQNGRAVLNRPTTSRCFAFCLSPKRTFGFRMNGKKHTNAVPTRIIISGIGPKAGAARRMNKNEAPQIADRPNNLAKSANCIALPHHSTLPS